MIFYDKFFKKTCKSHYYIKNIIFYNSIISSLEISLNTGTFLVISLHFIFEKKCINLILGWFYDTTKWRFFLSHLTHIVMRLIQFIRMKKNYYKIFVASLFKLKKSSNFVFILFSLTVAHPQIKQHIINSLNSDKTLHNMQNYFWFLHHYSFGQIMHIRNIWFFL